MAQSLRTIKELIRTSIHGLRVGLSHDDFLCGPKAPLKTVTNATSATTATALLPYGIHTLQTPSSKNWVLTDPPHPGLTVRFVCNTTSTKIHKVTPAAATINSTNGLAGSSFTMFGAGSYAELISISTAKWVVSSRYYSTSNADGSFTVSS